MIEDWQQRFIDAVEREYGANMPADVAAYLDTFKRDSAVNRDARERTWSELPLSRQWVLTDLLRATNPQLFGG